MRVKAGQTWEHESSLDPTQTVTVLTLRPPPPDGYEWECLVLRSSDRRSKPAGSVASFAVNNSDWWERIA